MGLIDDQSSLLGKAFDWISGNRAQGHADRQALAFAQNSVQWRVADALKAGVHPLYALGAPTFSPAVSTGGGSALSSSGQDVSRAVMAGMPREGQLSAFDEAVQALTLKKFGLENELLGSQIAKMNQDLLSKPAIPSLTLPGGARLIPGQSSSAQDVQNEYGDIVENVYGTARLGTDVFNQFVGPGFTRKLKQMHAGRRPLRQRLNTPIVPGAYLPGNLRR